MKKLATLSAILGISCLSSITYAADSSYNAELSASYGQGSVDGSDELDSSELSLGGAYYFSGVNTKTHPLAEAAFLERSSNVYAQWHKLDYDEFDATIDNGVVGVDFYVPDSMLFVGVGMAQVKVKDNSESDKDSYWIAKLGVTPLDGLLLWTQIREEIDSTDYWDINAKYVLPLSGENALNLEATYADWDDGDSETRIAADYYFSRNFSLGVGYSVQEVEGFDNVDGYELRARHFISETFSVQAGYTSSDEEDSWLVGASMRF